jgi:phage tail P2-like protein
MSDLLPANATGGERALSLAAERAGSVPVRVRDVWDPDTCPANLLAWMAWAFSVDDWDPAWTDAQKRAVIKASIEVHKYKGTIGAVREALAALGVDAQVQEWFAQIPAGAPYTFRILLTAEQTGITAGQQQKLLTVLENTKNLRSHLDRIEIIAKTAAGPSVAAASGIGSEIVLTAYEPPKLVFNETTICI